MFGVALLGIVGLGFTPMTDPETEAELGERLFFDPILSSDQTVSCASCHLPEFGFADTAALSVGVGGQLSDRNTPSCMNMTARRIFFYDGRAETLEIQALEPIRNAKEMNLPIAEAEKRLRTELKYVKWFKKIYNKKPDSTLLATALAAYMRTLESAGDARSDRWLNDEPNAMTEAELRGRKVFLVKGKCFDCHFSPDFTGDEFKNVGLFDGKMNNDAGRFNITGDSLDIGKFKVPSLRNIAITAPYMHDGRFKTLEEVVDFYDNPDKFIPNALNRDILLREPLNLTVEEKQNLVAFLKALTDEQFVHLLKK